MTVGYDLQKDKGCPLCVKEQEIQLLISALRGIVEYGGLMVEAAGLILKGASEDRLRAVRAKKEETSEKILKDLEAVSELRAAAYV